MTDQEGFYKYEVNPGIYSVECFYIGHITEQTKEIKIQSGQRVIIIFELGTSRNID